jgi:hypothetical protein
MVAVALTASDPGGASIKITETGVGPGTGGGDGIPPPLHPLNPAIAPKAKKAKTQFRTAIAQLRPLDPFPGPFQTHGRATDKIVSQRAALTYLTPQKPKIPAQTSAGTLNSDSQNPNPCP